MNNSKDIENLFKDKIRNFSRKAPDSVWDNLENRLKNENKKPKFVFVKRFLLILSLLFVFSCGIFYITQHIGYDKDKTVAQDSIFNINVNSDLTAEANRIEVNTSSKQNAIQATIVESVYKSNEETNIKSKVDINHRNGSFISNQPQESHIETGISISTQNVYQKINTNDGFGGNEIFHKKDFDLPLKQSDIQDPMSPFAEGVLKNRAIVKYNSIPKLDYQLIWDQRLGVTPTNFIKPAHIYLLKKRFTLSIEKSIWGSSYRSLKDNGQNTNDHINYFNSVEQKSSSSSVALLITYHTSSFSIESGIEYSKNSITGSQDFFIKYMPDEYSEFLYPTSFNANRMSILPTTIVGAESGDLVAYDNNIDQSISYISLPLHVLKSYEHSNFRFDFGIGAKMNFPIGQDLKINDSNGQQSFTQTRIEYQENNSKFLLDYSGKVRMSYPVYKGLYFSVSLSHQRSINSANKNKLVKFYPYSTRLNIGLQTNF